MLQLVNMIGDMHRIILTIVSKKFKSNFISDNQLKVCQKYINYNAKNVIGIGSKVDVPFGCDTYEASFEDSKTN
jgi:hypothetical protein